MSISKADLILRIIIGLSAIFFVTVIITCLAFLAGLKL